MFLSHLVQAYQQWRRYNLNLRELNRLGDRELADIGLTRGDIPRGAWEKSERYAALSASKMTAPAVWRALSFAGPFPGLRRPVPCPSP